MDELASGRYTYKTQEESTTLTKHYFVAMSKE